MSVTRPSRNCGFVRALVAWASGTALAACVGATARGAALIRTRRGDRRAPEMPDARRALAHCDGGLMIDDVEHEGRADLLDLNRTPSLGADPAVDARTAERLGDDVDALFDRALNAASGRRPNGYTPRGVVPCPPNSTKPKSSAS